MNFSETIAQTREFSDDSAVTPDRDISPMPRPKAKPRVRRGRLWFRIHSLVGLNLSLLIALICLTGTLAVFAAEVDWLTTPEMRAETSVAADDIAWTGIAISLAEHAPDAQINTIEAGPSPVFAPAAYLRQPDGGQSVVRFDPVTGAVQGEHSFLGAKSLLRAIHSRLLLGDQLGTALVSFTAFFLLASLVTALFAYRRWWRGFFRWPQRRRSARVFWGDFHRLAGLWSVLFGAVIALTGIWYFVEETGGPASRFERAAFADSEFTNSDAASRFPEALDTARAAYPELSIRRIDWPRDDNAGFVFYGQDGTILVRPRANGVGVSLATGEAAFRHTGSEGSVHQRISEASDPLHMGYFAGFWSKLFWFVSGGLLTFVAASGAVIYAKRLASEGDGHIRLRNLTVTLALPLIAIGAMLALLPGTIAALS